MENLPRELDQAQSADTAVGRLESFVRFHMSYHVSREEEVLIANSELRSLEPENLRVVNKLRRNYESRLIGILADGVAEGSFRPTDPKVAAYKILAMLTRVGTWHRPGGRLSKDEASEVFVTMVLNSVAVNSTAGAHLKKSAAPPARVSPTLKRASR